MLTKNGRKAITALQTDEVYEYVERAGGDQTTMISSSDVKSSLAPTTNGSYQQGVILDLSADTAAVTEDTWGLNTYISGADATSGTRTANSRGQVVYTYTGTNGNSSAITINKIGLRMRTSGSSSWNDNFYIVAENITPRVVQPGETYSFTIVI